MEFSWSPNCHSLGSHPCFDLVWFLLQSRNQLKRWSNPAQKDPNNCKCCNKCALLAKLPLIQCRRKINRVSRFPSVSHTSSHAWLTVSHSKGLAKTCWHSHVCGKHCAIPLLCFRLHQQSIASGWQKVWHEVGFQFFDILCRIAPKQQKVQLLDMPSTQGCTFWSPTTSRWRCKTLSQSFHRRSVWYLGALLHLPSTVITVHFLGMWYVPFFGGVPWMPATKNNDFCVCILSLFFCGSNF